MLRSMKSRISRRYSVRDELDVPPVAGGLGGAAYRGDLVGHRVGVGVHVELGAVREEGAVERLRRVELQPVGQLLADAASASAMRSGIVSTVGPVSKR
jgi:hypothetical protein